ncbi:MAG: germination protein YpeB [Christensenellales bacterium]
MKWKLFLKKHTLVIGLSVLLAGAVAFGIVQTVERNRTQYFLNNVYDKSFNDLADHMNNLEVSLSKLMVVSSPRMYLPLMSEICVHADQTRMLLGQLPVSHMVAGNLSQFVTRCGDYCNTLSKKLVDGGYLQKDDKDQLGSLYKTCNELNVSIAELQQNDQLRFDGMDNGIFLATAQDNQMDPVYKIQREDAQYPRLIYDGPFSESVMNAQPKGLTGNDLAIEEAKQKALDFLKTEGEISDAGEENGDLPTYVFRFETQDGLSLNMAVTKRGGHIVWMCVDRDAASGGIPTEDKAKECAEIAEDYMRIRGFEMQATYAQYYSGEAVINLACLEKGVILYPDLIKVWVDIESGKVVSLDARNYLMAHQERNIPIDQTITPDEAKQNLSYTLQPESERLALIPLDNGQEVLCYEFSGMFRGNRFYVYINAQNGREEDVLKVIDTESGTLVQ